MKEFIKTDYLTKYSDDELGNEINEKATYKGVIRCINMGLSVYEYLNVYDSLLREGVFTLLSEKFNIPYNDIYDSWLYGTKLKIN